MRNARVHGFRILVLLLSGAVYSGAASAEKFKKTYDPFKNIGTEQVSPAYPANQEQVLLGAALYVDHCVECHGAALEGAENWQDSTGDGTYLPPPHDDSGHTWHHSDKVLFEYVKLGGAELFKDTRTSFLQCRALAINSATKRFGLSSRSSKTAGPRKAATCRRHPRNTILCRRNIIRHPSMPANEHP